MNQATIQMEIIEAVPDDFKILRGWFQSGNNQVKKYKRKIGQIYWVKSQITKQYEGPYIIDEQTDMNFLGHYLERKMVFIPKHVLETKIKTITEAVEAL